MKKLLLSLTAILTLGANSLFADVFAVYSWAAASTEGSKAGQGWDYLYDANNVTYHEQSGYWITNATYEGEGATATIVVADNFSDITENPIVGASTLDAEQYATEDIYFYGYPARVFYNWHKGDMVGNFTSLYNTTPYSTYDFTRFLRYP